MSESLPFLGLMAFMAGLIDAAVGGGGLIQIPALFNALPHVAPATLFGTNKVAAVSGTLFAARSYVRQVRLPWKLVLPAALAAFAFSFVGASVVSWIPKSVMRPLVLVLLLLMAVYTLWKKDFGALHAPVSIGRRERVLATALGGAIGFYDGVFGPGTGSFLIFLFIRCFAFDFLHASAAAKFVNIATNIAALSYFLPQDQVLWHYALPMAACNVLGAISGSWLALRGGSQVVRVLFLVLLTVLIGRFAWEVLG
ncbi:sulfite exporter TauE/SafE family protein [Rivihabitans pingtungensis]|jgi:hypothetical protein|uniref:Probable membrane transporter protein n=1 Tax=Rivihabitans pingtungensis TaxID=1054498 RepID=A0A318KJP1_9NEIS|nr:TSUP family transporter [Rivihabitans pingtungensis]MCK6436628.1 TSUP family transporter [Rivihabitans pingtungensis]PXX78071.1 hypothetical protein DFR34_11380 [Rivihabitans pingtungensis]